MLIWVLAEAAGYEPHGNLSIIITSEHGIIRFDQDCKGLIPTLEK